MEFGKKLRELRTRRGMTLAEVGHAAGLSRSFISQVESGQNTASIASLKRICGVLNITLAELFDEEAALPAPDETRVNDPVADVRIVRKDRRKAFKYPGAESMMYLLVPDLRRKLEVMLGHMQPGETNEVEAWSHDGEEFGLILEGTYELMIEGRSFVLEEGDSIYFPSRLPHSARVVGNRPVRWLWVITPPSF